MCDCEKDNKDSYCGCNNFDGLFGYDIDINKKNKSEKTESTSATTQKESAPKKKFDLSGLKDIGDTLGSALAGFKTGGGSQSSTPSTYVAPQGPVSKQDSDYTWYYVGGGVLVLVIILYFVLRKK